VSWPDETVWVLGATLLIVLAGAFVWRGFSAIGLPDAAAVFAFLYTVALLPVFFGTMAIQDHAGRAMGVRAIGRGVEVRMPLQSGEFLLRWDDIVSVAPRSAGHLGRVSYRKQATTTRGGFVLLTPEQFEAVTRAPEFPSRLLAAELRSA
jgi:hypothetical protein